MVGSSGRRGFSHRLAMDRTISRLRPKRPLRTMVSALVGARSAEKTAAGSAPPPRRFLSASLPAISVRFATVAASSNCSRVLARPK